MLKGVGSVVKWLGIAAGSLSLVMLINRGIEIGWTAPLQTMLDFYHQLIGYVFNWAETPLASILARLGAFFSIDLQLYPHWKDVVVLLWLYFSADSRMYLSGGRILRGMFGLLSGMAIAIISGVASGTVPLTDAPSNMLMAAFPIAGVIFYELLRYIWAVFFMNPEDKRPWWRRLASWMLIPRGPVGLTIIGGIALIIGTQANRIPILRAVSVSGLVVLGTFIVSLALIWISDGFRWARIMPDTGERSDESLWQRLVNGNTLIGLYTLAAVAGAALFIALNAGLKLAGL
ncbi:MAG: hypothetical protein WAW96_16590 [Alphaproteobacteria bacterium]